ncbi:energy-coupling factor transporter transmembrane protein EcfT [Alicyclobacillus tolerans]|uniref:energy-coupling factor transporter transmembrane component T family protein n=1 Tax=Alicyclobacillus tolerans TaxID=90970 RepID=UPI001F2CDDAC|nr:energy-coupling factor transporter transmembrane component T [Alicyclobacillus tolerans]MCF8565135.1 energy-coupling factor transporter transmembrane protein EcfT [Alicyclobacillus tolerans]
MAGEFELTRNITIGQYVPTNSIIHRFDPRFKLAMFAVLILTISFLSSYLANVAALILSLLLFYVSEIPLSYGMSGVKPALPFMIALAVLQLLFYGGVADTGIVLFHYGIIDITTASVKLVVVSAMRFVEIIFVTSVLTLSTTITELTHGMELLLRPLKVFKIPVHAFALIMTIAIRFVPTFAIEMEKMMKAQASRGAEFGTGQWWRIVQRTRDMFPIIVPLFNVALARAEDLVLAMEARCYTPTDERTSYKRYEAKPLDYVVLAVGLVVSAALIAIPFPY